MNNPALLIAIGASVASVLIALFVAPVGSGYRIAPVFLIPLIWVVYALRRRLHLTPLIYGAFIVAVLFHNLGGANGSYQKRYFGINFDAYVHSYFGFVGGLIFHRLVAGSVPSLRPWQVGFATLLFVMGSGAIHELMEWGSTLVLGEERGMLKSEKVAPFDTQRDLFSNLLGVTVAITLMTLHAARRKSRQSIESDLPAAGVPAAAAR